MRVNRHLHVNVKHAFNQLRATDVVVANRAGDAPLFKEYQQIGVVHRKVKVMEHCHHRAAMFAGEGLEQLKDIDLIAQIEPVVGSSSRMVAVCWASAMAIQQR